MQKKLLTTYLVLIVLTMIISSIFSWTRVNSYLNDRVTDEAVKQMTLLYDLLENEYDSQGNLDTFVNQYADKMGSRITIIDIDGSVIAESDYDKADMDDHSTRVEVRTALETGEIASSTRFSRTLNTYLEYVAMPIHHNGFEGVLRTATPVSEIRSIINETVMMILIGILVSALVAFIVAFFMTRRLMRPINELTVAAGRIAQGDYENKIYIDQKDQIGELAKTFNTMTSELRMNMWALKQKNSELESILASMTNGILVVDVDYKITLFNDIFIKLFQVHDPNLAGKVFYEATRNLMVFQVLERSFEQHEHVVQEAKFQTAEGERIYLLFASPILSESDKPGGTLLVVQDVTQIRKLETMRSDFVSNVTHELKTPLTSIRGFVDTLKHGAINQEVGIKFLDIIDIEAERLELLINDILTLSEIENLMGDKNRGHYALTEIGDEVISLLTSKAEEKHLEIKKDYEADLPLFVCNRNRIKQLFINLMDNAIKYTETGHVCLNLRKEFNQYVIEVEDTGIGIDKSHIPRLFERFYRVDKGRSRKMGGTGLGLSIVKHIVELYNGHIKVKSEPNQGTTITIRLPISTVADITNKTAAGV